MKNNPDLVAAVRDQSLISREMAKDLARIAGDTELLRDNLHGLRDDLGAQLTGRDEAMRQVQFAMGQANDKLDAMLAHMESLQSQMVQGFREDRFRLRALEGNPDSETTNNGRQR
jgi:hypothetical protein